MPNPVTPIQSRVAAKPNAEAGTEFPRIAGYRFEKRIGQGGMASVYLATQESLDRPVSIKVMEREGLQDEVSMQRFENEARTIAKLTHPSIVNIYEVGRTGDGRMYYIMPFLPNGDLSQRDLRNNEAGIIDVLRALLSALDYAHTRGIVHRDVKQENVLFDVANRPLLTDFGIALSKRDTSRITGVGLAVGSSGYMAPEQARGDVVDGRADLYSLGVLTHESLTGRLPYRSPDALALALMHAQKPIPKLPPGKRHWQAFVDRAMAKSPDHRFQNAQQMLQALERVDSRSGDHLSGRVLRNVDRTLDTQFWKRPGGIALLGAFVVVAGMYAMRDRLPGSGLSSAGSTQEHPIAAPASGATDAPKAAAPLNSGAIVWTAQPAKPNPSPAPAAIPPPAAAPVALLPAAAPSASAAAMAASLSPDAAVLGEARDALAHANLTAPADDNAFDLSRMAWKLSPATPETKQLAADVLVALAKQQALAIAQHHDPRVLDFQQKVQQLADATIGRTPPAWRSVHAIAADALDKRVLAESAANDAPALKRSATLAKQLELADVYAHSLATARKIAQATAASAAAPIDVGPGYVLLHPASKGHPAVALARSEVTRHEYAQFVNATRRPAAACGDQAATTPAADGTRKNWTQPGFAQASEQPVVCVSWNDANAYAQWLGAHDGQRYRLASEADVREAAAANAGIAGTFSGWLENCASGCQNHLVAGRAWHGGDAAAGRAGGRGYDDVGFRVAREIASH